jgi:TIR domain-containing protein
MASIFLCHSSKDKFFVRELAGKLSAAGVRVWLDEAEINIGDSLTAKIGKAIDQMDFFAVVLSRHSVASEWVQRELQIAMQRELKERKVIVLPLLIEPVDLPPFLRDKLYADFTNPERFSATFPKLLEALGLKAAAPTPRPPEESPPPVPPKSPTQRRLAEFEDLTIVDLDLGKSYNPDPQYALYNMYLRLPRTPPEEWQQIFDAERSFPRHTMWRKAWVEGPHIVVYCVPEELEKYHMRDLLEDVKNCNAKYRGYLTELAQREVREASKQQKQRDELRELKKRLGFE